MKFEYRLATIGTTPACLTSENEAIVGVQLHAKAANSGTIYVGAANVSSTKGYPLAAGEGLYLPVTQLNDIFVVGSASGQVLDQIILKKS